MRHPTEGTLRRLLDEPAGVADTDRDHVADCPVCLSGLAAAQQDADLIRAALHVDPAVDVDSGWSRFTQAAADAGHRRSTRTAFASRWRAALRSPVVAVVGAAALLTGASAAAAVDWLQIFRTEQITPVAITEADLVRLPDLTAYGDVEVTQEVDIREVSDAAAAQEATGLSVPQVAELPQGVAGDPVLQVGDQVSADFTFSAEQAQQAAADAGESLPPPPAGLDGSRFRLVAGPGVVSLWSSQQGLPALIVARAMAPTGSSSGMPFATARDYLLSLPGLPEDVATQLGSFTDDGTTLPLPVPAEQMSSAATAVNGVPATVLTSSDGTMTGVVWVQDGIVTAVAGSLSSDEVLSVARGLERP
ncbi:MAG: hypothetical protein M3424_09790 [Actinomycetota bacterium]|nr:hypothetical protein [Actinomycetota bacterium]